MPRSMTVDVPSPPGRAVADSIPDAPSALLSGEAHPSLQESPHGFSDLVGPLFGTTSSTTIEQGGALTPDEGKPAVHDLTTVAPAFVEMAHRIVWCVAATTDTSGNPSTRVLHPVWEWDGEQLTGWIATSPLSPKAEHLARTPSVSLTY